MNRDNISIKTEEEITLMRESGIILQKAQQAIKDILVPGVSLLELDQVAEEVIRNEGGIPAFKGYHGFPATLCTNLNEEVVHGIPNQRTLSEGDIISIDCGVIWKGYVSDAAFTVIVGGEESNPARAKFSRVVQQALEAGCEAARVGNTLGDIGYAIESVVQAGGYSICREYTGHGLGTAMHEPPYVLNYGTPGKGMVLEAGMTLAIEPIVAMGSGKTKLLRDKWTVVTSDGKDGCQWEHCGVVRENGFEIFA